VNSDWDGGYESKAIRLHKALLQNLLLSRHRSSTATAMETTCSILNLD